MNRVLKAAGAAAALMFAAQAWAVDWITTVHVNAVEVTSVPTAITFWVDGPAGSCVDGQGLGPQLSWSVHGTTAADMAANVQAALATLLTARASDRPVKIFGRNSDCKVEFMYLA